MKKLQKAYVLLYQVQSVFAFPISDIGIFFVSHLNVKQVTTKYSVLMSGLKCWTLTVVVYVKSS